MGEEISIPSRDVDVNWNASKGKCFFGSYKLQSVAVKTLTAKQKKAFEEIYYFNHPNLIKIFGVVEDRIGAPDLLVMEKLDGSLYDLLHVTKTILPLNEKLSILQDVIRGLTYLHLECNRHHGRISSRRILLNDLRAKIGLCDLQPKDDTDSESFDRNFIYMAPEFMDDDVDNLMASDIYSLGILIWECVSGQKPWGEIVTLMGMVKLLIANKRPTLPVIGKTMTVLDEFINQCWQQDPSCRLISREIVGRFQVVRNNMKSLDSEQN